MTKPVRLRLSRAKGFNLQAHSRAVNGLPALNAARPGALGNPFIVGRDGTRMACVQQHQLLVFDGYIPHDISPERHRELRTYLENITTHLRLGEYRGQNIACWCELPTRGQWDCCHGATLLKVFNR